MRSAIILIITIVVLATGFGLYLWWQAPTVTKTHAAGDIRSEQTKRLLTEGPATAPANPNLKIDDGKNIFVESYDKKTGALASRFRAARYVPKSDGTIDTTLPEAEFYLNNGQVLHLRGTTGMIVVASTPGDHGMGKSQMPSRGLLHDVILQLYPIAGAKKPSMTCRMNNASFDNETFSVATEAYTDPTTGEHVAADQVAVQVRGEDYDFDGRGLTLHWDERDRKLQSLEIAHGKTLVLKHPKAMHFGPTTAPSGKPAAPQSMLDGRWNPFADQLVSTDRNSVREVLAAPISPPSAKRPTKRRPKPSTTPTTKPTSRPRSLDLYRATFSDNVRVVQDGKQIATADVMNVEFATLGKPRELTEAEAAATQQAATAPSEMPAVPEITLPGGSPQTQTPPTPSLTTTTKPAHNPKHGATTQPARAASQPTTQPGESPITVFWTGTLNVLPFAESDVTDPPTTTNDTVVEMLSTKHPVKIDWQGSKIVCGSFRYHTSDDTVQIHNSEFVPVITLDDAKGSHVSSPSLTYSGVQHIVDIPGPAFIEMPAEESASNPATAPSLPTTQPTLARIDWKESCMLQLAGATREQLTLSHAEFDGDVHVAHPQLQLMSQSMQVDFQPIEKKTAGFTEELAMPTTNPTTRPAMNVAIRQLIATDRVHSEIHDPSKGDAPPQLVDCDQLMVAFDSAADGRTYPRTVTADGSVITGDGSSQLEAAHLDATLAPSTQPTTQTANGGQQSMPAVELKSMFAHTNVRGHSTDGRMLEAQQLEVATSADGSMQYKLLGPPDARLGTGTTTLSGPIITFDPASGKADVFGPGTLHGIQESARSARAATQSSTPPATQPIDVRWQDRMHADTLVNKIEIFGDVHAESKMSDGSKNVVTGAKLTMTLADTPTTQPTTMKSPSTKPARQSMFGSSNQNDAFKDKVVRLVTVEDPKQVEVKSTLVDAAGNLLRRLNVQSLTLNYDPIDKRLHIPVAGRMLYENELAPTTRPTTRPTTMPATAPTTVAENAKPGSPMGNMSDMHGATAFQWQKDLTYDDTNHTVVMTGDVQVVHQSIGATSPAYRVNAGRILAELDSSVTDKSTTKPATQATTKPADDSNLGGAKLKHLVADGGVIFIAQRLHFESRTIEFDPATNLLTAHGSERDPAVLYDDAGLSTGTFTDMVYDTKTDKMKLTNFRASIRK